MKPCPLAVDIVREGKWMDEGLAGITEALARLTDTARGGGLTQRAALASLTTARRLATELEGGEVALIEAARRGGATWSQIAAAMGASRRQTAQKRHADLSRRHPLPRAVDTPEPATASTESGGTTPRSHPGGDRPPAAAPAGGTGPGGPAAPTGGRTPDAAAQAAATACHPRADDLASAPPRPASAARRRPTAPKITAAVIAEGRYEIVKAADHAESRAWHVLVGGKRAGLVRPTWRGERARRAWEPVTNAGNALPVTGTSRVTPAGNARDRDAAAVSLLQALRRQQEGKTASY